WWATAPRVRALALGEAVEAADARRATAQRRRREARVAWPAAARPRCEVADGGVLVPGPAGARSARRSEGGKVGAVGAQGRGREAAFDAEVGEELVDRPVQGGWGRHVSPTRRGPSATTPPGPARPAPRP